MKKNKGKIQKVVVSRDHKVLYKGAQRRVVYSHFPLGIARRWFFLISRDMSLFKATESQAFRKFIRKKTKRQKACSFTTRTVPFVHLTKKSSGIRMGKGKGSKVYSSVMPMNSGYILSSIRYTRKYTARLLQSRLRKKLSTFVGLRDFIITKDVEQFSMHRKCVDFHFGERFFNKKRYGKFDFLLLKNFNKLPEGRKAIY